MDASAQDARRSRPRSKAIGSIHLALQATDLLGNGDVFAVPEGEGRVREHIDRDVQRRL